MSKRCVTLAVVLSLLNIVQVLGADESEKEIDAKLPGKIIDAVGSGKLDVLGPFNFKDGQVGYLTSASVGIFRFMQIIGPDSALVGYEENRGRFLGEPILVTMSTKGFVDNDVFPRKQILLAVDGTTRYETVDGGTKTVHVLKAVESKLLADTIKFMDDQEAQECTRLWMDASGKFSVKAKFVKFSSGSVTLQRQDTGKEIDVPSSKLDEESRKWMQTWLKGSKKRDAVRKSLKAIQERFDMQ